MKGIKIFFVLLIFMLVIGAVMNGHETSDKRPGDQFQSEVRQIKSKNDRDQDGIDDQTDILQGALNYVARRPAYESKYYATGYPDDNCGVCTDLVAFALLDAGYDLMELVHEDITYNLAEYDIDVPDKNIDFRRVNNLEVYFSRHAKQLTTDLSDIEAWQGGDIVIFDDHIGIVSEQRNANGVPYVIHHKATLQKQYEEDILEERDDLQSHYRITG